MKKFTGTILITAALLTHVAIVVCTEESYTFTSSDVVLPTIEFASAPAITTSSSPVVPGSLTRSTGFYFAEQELVP